MPRLYFDRVIIIAIIIIVIIIIAIIAIIIIIYTIILFKSVCRCSLTAGRNSCSIVSGDVSNCSYRLTVHLSRVRFSVRPSNFFMRNTSKTSGKSGRAGVCLFEWPATGIVASGAGRHGWAPPNSDILYGGDGSDGGVCARACVRA